jgi:hypothetical protein
MKTPEQILVELKVLASEDLDARFNLNLTRDGYLHTVKLIIEAMKEYGKQCAIQAIDDTKGYYTDTEYVPGKSGEEWLKDIGL